MGQTGARTLLYSYGFLKTNLTPALPTDAETATEQNQATEIIDPDTGEIRA